MSQSGTATQSHIQDLSDSPAISTAVPLVGRILMAAIFLISGLGKIAAPAGTIGYIASAGLPFPQLGLAIAVFVEVVGGIALIAGYRTRIVAAVLAIFCVATAFSFHFNLVDQNQFIHFFKNIAWSVGYCRPVAFGADRFRLDARWS